MIDEVIEPALTAWVEASPNAAEAELREERAQVVFGLGGVPWDGVRVLERYELLYEVGLLAESPAAAGRRHWRHRCRCKATTAASWPRRSAGCGASSPTARSCSSCCPPRSRCSPLQRLVEALSGVRLHKQNFRRLVEGAGLVEGTGPAGSQRRSPGRAVPLPSRRAAGASTARRRHALDPQLMPQGGAPPEPASFGST